jgi:flavin-dependent dehydrogenase
MATNKGVDVAVIGGGPAGTSTALALARSGLKVAVLERSSYDGVRVGETLPPEIKELLTSLSLWDRFLSDGHQVSPGIIVSWGSENIHDNDFISNPYGHGWHIDRSRFDRMLASAAEKAGTCLYTGVRVVACSDDSGAWLLELDAGGKRSSLSCRFVVEATGRSRSFAHNPGVQRTALDRLIGVVGFYKKRAHQDRAHWRTLIESCEKGWWYSAQVPGDRLVVAFMTDADLTPTAYKDVAAAWETSLDASIHTRARVRGGTLDSKLHVFSAGSYLNSSIAGNNRLAVGDAASAFDPLSAQGIYRAMECGLVAAEKIGQWLNGSRSSLGEYERIIKGEFSRYWEDRRKYYSAERRWPTSEFWRRRQNGHQMRAHR